MVLGKLPVPGRPTIWIIVGQGPTALAVGAGGGCLDIFTLIYPFFPLSPSLWETARYRLKYCLKGPLSPKTTNQPTATPTQFRPPPSPCHYPYGHNAMGYLHLNNCLGSELYLLTLHKRQVGHGNHGSPSESFFVTATAVNCVR